ncbi:hypothetical protein KP509_21G014700 [Ceratopteris richardii]|uniref:Uncharacterized protein n=1 Tax=Ceratopteris richardii TaxID=49495 RepID=A0A8T2SAY7_CERRI|nr:hypothetical protein KP509_21G014700 [Ceratopteris richardii]
MAAIHPSAAPSSSSSSFTSTRTSRAKNAAATPSMATARLPSIHAPAAVIMETSIRAPTLPNNCINDPPTSSPRSLPYRSLHSLSSIRLLFLLGFVVERS